MRLYLYSNKKLILFHPVAPKIVIIGMDMQVCAVLEKEMCVLKVVHVAAGVMSHRRFIGQEILHKIVIFCLEVHKLSAACRIQVLKREKFLLHSAFRLHHHTNGKVAGHKRAKRVLELQNKTVARFQMDIASVIVRVILFH